MLKFSLLLLLLLVNVASSNAEVYNSKDMVVVAGTIRQDAQDPSKWCWINDAYHTPTGVDRTLCHTASNGKIVVNYGVKYKKVVTFIVNADETYTSQLGMSVGVSAGLDLSILELTSHGAKIYPSQDLNYRAGNIWIYALMEPY